MKNVFSFNDYQSFLKHRLAAARGLKTKAAKAVAIQTTYLSKVLSGGAHLNLEQSYAFCEFLGLDQKETEYFLLLVQRDRAGSPPLREYFKSKLAEEDNKRKQLKNILDKTEELSELDQSRYYSKWYYAAIHILSSVPVMQTREAMSRALQLPVVVVNHALEFLIQNGLVVQEGESFVIGPRHIHLSNESEFILQHHSNWRQKSLQKLEYPQAESFHYSGVISLSENDAEILRERMLEMVRDNLKTVAPSKEEVVYCSLIDFFKLA